jgi:hypothetical protein
VALVRVGDEGVEVVHGKVEFDGMHRCGR